MNSSVVLVSARMPKPRGIQTKNQQIALTGQTPIPESGHFGRPREESFPAVAVSTAPYEFTMNFRTFHALMELLQRGYGLIYL